MNWLHYLLEANLYLAVFYAGYYLFLSRETYYTLNRIYLLFSCVASFVLPILQLGILKPIEQPVTAVNFSFPVENIPVSTVNYVPATQPLFTWQDGLVYAYILGAGVLLIMLLVKLYQLFRLTRVENLGSDDQYKIIYIDRSETAFSFFNYLFIGTKVKGPETIIQHELVHIRQKHSADIIFIELLKIVNWFNPIIYLVQYSLKTLHEYIADEKTAASGSDALAYSSFLVNNAYGIDGASITNSFFNYNLLKKRIIMLNQKRSGSLARLKYLLAIPICGGLLCASTLAFSKTYGWVDVGPHRIDKNNHSPQVAEPVKRLLVTRNGISTITDKFSDKRANGTVRIYTANNLSNKDVVDLEKKGIIVNVLYGVKKDTTKTDMAPPAREVKIDYLKERNSATTSKGYKYYELVWEKNGKRDMQVTIIDKDNGHIIFDKSKATATELAMLKDKYGYVFPAHIKMPPPPPAPPVPSADRLTPPSAEVPGKMPPPPSGDQMAPPPPPAPPVKASNVTSGKSRNLPPPPPPFESEYKGLLEYLSQNVVYPASAISNHTAGTGIVQYTLDANHKITNISILKGTNPVFNKEVIAKMESFNDPISKIPGTYTLGFRFSIAGETNNDEARKGDSEMSQTPNYTGEISIVGQPATQTVPPVKTGMIMQKAKGSIIKAKKADEGSVYSDISTRWEAIAFIPNKKGC